MPFIDVSDVLLDPDFSTTITVTRTATGPAVGGFARLISTDTPNVVAVVVPATSDDLQRMPDAEHLSGSIAIFTTFKLISKTAGYTADVVTWGGNRYTVQTVDDWSEFGSGYVRALASLLDLT